MKETSLDWLEYFENLHKNTLFQNNKAEINLLERFIELVTKISEEISIQIPDVTLKELRESEDDELVCKGVSGLLIGTATRRLYAARKLLLAGYPESMFGSLRDMIESLYYSDICRQSASKAKRWLKFGYIEKPASLKVHHCLEEDRKGEAWEILSGAGIHPCLSGKFLSISYEIPTIAEFRRNHHILKRDWKRLMDQKKIEEMHEIIMFAIMLVHDDFIIYLNDTYSDICDDIDEIRTKMEELENEYHKLPVGKP